MCMCMYIYNKFLYAHMLVYVCAYVYVHVYVHVCAYVHVYVYMYVVTYVNVYAYIQISISHHYITHLGGGHQ